MKFMKLLYVVCWIISIASFFLFLIFEKSFFLLFITIGLGTVSFLEYKKFKERDDLGYLNRRLVFVYAIGAFFSLYAFIFVIR